MGFGPSLTSLKAGFDPGPQANDVQGEVIETADEDRHGSGKQNRRHRRVQGAPPR